MLTMKKNKPSDASVVAAASNNTVTINKDQNIFDSKKKIKAASTSELEYKLNSNQRKHIAYNEILLCINSNQYDLATKLLEPFLGKYKDEGLYTRLKTTLLCKEKRMDDVEKLLTEYSKNDSKLKFSLLQVFLMRNKLKQAIDIVKSIDSYLKYPGMVSFLVSLYNKLGMSNEVAELLQNAIEYVKTFAPDEGILQIYLKKNANFQIKCGNYPKAAETFEILYASNPNDYKLLSQLINAYSKFDENKAKSLSEKLPPLEKLFQNSKIDVDTLEKQFSTMSSKYAKSKSNKDDLKPKSDGVSVVAADLAKKKKTKKKRKVKLPKNCDQNVPLDAERWLPLRERSYYKGKRKKKTQNVGKGTQGAVSTEQQQQSPIASPITSPQKAQSEKLSATSAKPKPSVSQQKKKKKGPKW